MINPAVTLSEDGTQEATQGLDKRTVRNIFLVLVELARGEIATVFHQWFLQFLNQPRLADAGQARDEHRQEGSLCNL